MALAPTRARPAVVSQHRAVPSARRQRRAQGPAPVRVADSFSSTVAKLKAESAATIAGDRGLGDIASQLARIKALDEPGPRKTVTIIGGGMAALAAAYELEKLGHRVHILEGSDRLGGRIWTKRFDDGSYHELGAMRIPKGHDYTRHYVDELGLPLRHFVTSGDDQDAFYDIAGVETTMRDAKEKLNPKFDLSEADRAAPSAGSILDQHLHALLERLTEEEKQSLFSTQLSSERLRELDRTSLSTFLRDRGEGDGALELIGAETGLAVELDRPVTVYLREEIRRTGEGLEEIVGGMDQLPNGIASRIKGEIELNTRVLGIKNRDDGKVELTLSRNGGDPVTELHDDVLVTLPFSVLRGLDTEGFSAGKQKAIREMAYGSATKVLLDTKRRFWESDYQIHGGASHSDGITGATYYPSDNAEAQDPEVSAGPGVMVGSYVWGSDARRLAAMTPEERVRTVVKTVARFHPEIAEPGMVKDSASISWDQNPWSAGAYGLPAVGQAGLYKDAIKAEGHVHFAGEHLSYDPGWIQGALISSLRAVEEIVTAKKP